MKLKITKPLSSFVADPVDFPGSPACGYGRTIKEAIGDFVLMQGTPVTLTISEIDVSEVQATVKRQQARELRKR